MAEEQKQGNVRLEYNNGTVGLNMDQTLNQIKPGTLTYALNAALENFDASSVNYQNEQGNEFCLQFPSGYHLIGTHFIAEQNKHIFFITNPELENSQIGYMDNNDCIYNIYIEAPCLNFNVKYPIHKIVHKITNCGTEIYWTDGYNPRRYLDLNNIPFVLAPLSQFCSPTYTDEIDCNQLKMQPNFNIPELSIIDVTTGGELIAGTYQFAIQYADPAGNPYTSYYSVTNPTPIADIFLTTVNFNYPVGKSIVVNINNLDISGQFQYYNLAVIKTINDITSVELVGTYFINNDNMQITYTGQNVEQERLVIADIFEKYPYYDIAQDLTAVQDILVWDNLTSIDRINYQKIASGINLLWETYKMPADEDYSDELNATNLRGYLRDEVYAFEIVFLLKNGKQTDGFHIPGRALSVNELSKPNIEITDPDFIGEPEPDTTYSPYWKIYNTASVIGAATGIKIGNATPYEYGEFAYWESTEVYPCNVDVWGDLANTPIRHHKFPDVLVSPHYESAMFVDSKSMVMQNDSVFPIGVKLDVQQVQGLINYSDLTKEQKSEIVGFKIVRGNRSTNKSIVGKGILRNVGKYTREDQDFYYPNYPYNDLEEDPFINGDNNSYNQECVAWLVLCYEDGELEYTDCNTFDKVRMPMVKGFSSTSNSVCNAYWYEFCSIGKPRTITGEAAIGPANFDVVKIPWWGAGVNGGTNPRGLTAEWVIGLLYNRNDIVEGVAEQWIPGDDDYQDGGANTYATTVVDGNVYIKNHFPTLFPLSETMESPVQALNTVGYCLIKNNNGYQYDQNGQLAFGINFYKGRRSTLICGESFPLKGMNTEASQYRQVFNSPETSFGQPFLGQVLKLENVMFGRGRAHFVQVKNNAKYKLLSKEAQIDALNSSAEIAAITTGQFNATAMFTAYQAYLTIYINGITRKNYAYSYNSRANYDYSADVENGLGIKQRPIDIVNYLIPVVQSVGEAGGININNYQRESSVYIKTKETNFDNPLIPLPYPSKTDSLLDPSGNSIVTDKSRLTISGSNVCNTPAKEQDISVVSYYASLKNIFVNQWGQIYSYETIDTGYQIDLNSGSLVSDVVFGGDTFISKFAFKTKLPFFFDNRVGAPDDSDIFYDEIGNVGYPKYWHSARSVLENYLAGSTLMANIISFKAHNFDCPNDPSLIPPPALDPLNQVSANASSRRTFYDGFFYLFAYGVPNFYCESSYNVDLRQAFNNREGDFWPHVSTGIPDDWFQESYVTIAQDNTYNYNITYSKQNKENVFTHLPPDWKSQFCFTYYPFRAIYSDPQETNADNRVNNWLSYSALSSYDFPQNYGGLISLDGIQNKAVLARFENKSLLYNNLLTVNTSNPQAAYLGNPNLFAGAPPIDFAETDLGYVGSQNKFLLKIPQGQITIDAKRGQVFLISGTQSVDLSAFGSGMNRFFTDHLAFEIIRYFPTTQTMIDGQLITIPGVDTDNNFNGLGLHGVYDSKFDRIIISKLDYIPLDNNIKYDYTTKTFYIEDVINDVVIKTEVYLTDPEYFCNKSWTISFNMNTKTWVSFHSYIPNWYIGENNFFYSGINGCCDDLDVATSFTALVGINTGKPALTTTSSTSMSPPLFTTTTTTTEALDCILEGEVIITNCILDGAGVITVPPVPTTTLCARSSDFNFIAFLYTGYQVDVNPPVVSTGSLEDVCNAIAFSKTDNPSITTVNFTASVLTPSLFTGQVLVIGELVYYDYFSNDCTLVPDGWYFNGQSLSEDSGSMYNAAYHIVDGVVTEIQDCDCATTTTTTTIPPDVPECCGILFSSNDSIYFKNTIDNMISQLTVPGYVSSLGIAMTANYLWSIDTDIKQWDIDLTPFSATYNRAISFPAGFTTSSGIVALNSTILIAVNDTPSPEKVVEIDVTDLIGVKTDVITLQVDRASQGNMLYTTEGKLIILSQDVTTSDYYITQYDYATGTLEIDINITIPTIGNPVSLFECDCNLYITNTAGIVFLIDKLNPYDIVELDPLGISSISSSTQVSSCVTVSLLENIIITTTTTTTL